MKINAWAAARGSDLIGVGPGHQNLFERSPVDSDVQPGLKIPLL